MLVLLELLLELFNPILGSFKKPLVGPELDCCCRELRLQVGRRILWCKWRLEGVDCIRSGRQEQTRTLQDSYVPQGKTPGLGQPCVVSCGTTSALMEIPGPQSIYQ